jgi:hypothetical protein
MHGCVNLNICYAGSIVWHVSNMRAHVCRYACAYSAAISGLPLWLPYRMLYRFTFDEFPVTVNSGREWIAWREVRSCARMWRSRDISGGKVGSAELGQMRNRVHVLAGARDSLLANPVGCVLGTLLGVQQLEPMLTTHPHLYSSNSIVCRYAFVVSCHLMMCWLIKHRAALSHNFHKLLKL